MRWYIRVQRRQCALGRRLAWVLESVVSRYRGKGTRLYFRGDAAFANPDIYQFLEVEGMATRSGCEPTWSCRKRLDTCSSARSVDRRMRCAATMPASAGPVGRPPHEVRRYY